MSFLAGVPGKLKVLQDNITTLLSNYTSTVAGRIDATISSRAPSSTALSSVQWTNARAAFLDKLAGVDTINASPVVKAPIAINTPSVRSALHQPLQAASGLTIFLDNAPAGYSTALNLTGRGVLSFLAVAHAAASGGDCGCRITIDGNVVFNSTNIFGTSLVTGTVFVGAIGVNGSNEISGIAFDQVPFNTSLLVEFYTTSGPSSMYCFSRWRKSE